MSDRQGSSQVPADAGGTSLPTTPQSTTASDSVPFDREFSSPMTRQADQEPPSPAEFGLSPQAVDLEVGNTVPGLHEDTIPGRNHRQGSCSSISSNRHGRGVSHSGAGNVRSAHTSTATTATTTPTSNFAPSYGQSPIVQTRAYPGGGAAASGGAVNTSTANPYTPYLVGGNHRRHRSRQHPLHAHRSAPRASRTNSGGSQESSRSREQNRARNANDSDDAFGSSYTGSNSGGVGGGDRRATAPTRPDTGATATAAMQEHHRSHEVKGAADANSSSDDDREWRHTGLGRHTHQPHHRGGKEVTGGEERHLAAAAATDRDRRLTTTNAPGFGLSLPSPHSTASGGDDNAEDDRGGGLLAVPGLPRAGGSSTNTSKGENIYSLAPSNDTSRRGTPVSPSMWMDRAYTSTEAQMAILREQHEDARMREALRAAGVRLEDSPQVKAGAHPDPSFYTASPSGNSEAIEHALPAIHMTAPVDGAPHRAPADPSAAGVLSHFSGRGTSPARRFGAGTATTTAAGAGTGAESNAAKGSPCRDDEAASQGTKHANAGKSEDGGNPTPVLDTGRDAAAQKPIPLLRSRTAPHSVTTTAASLPAYTALPTDGGGNSSGGNPTTGVAAGDGKQPKSVSWQQKGRQHDLQRYPGGPGSPTIRDEGLPTPPPAGSMPDFSRTMRSQNNMSFSMNNSFGNFSFGNFSLLKDPLAASFIMQSNRSALITELERRREKLKKQLSQLQREATARNIFALVRSSNASQLQYLLQQRLCNVNERDYNGCTPLHVAAAEGNQAIISVLLSFGADVVAVDHLGRTALDCAAANRHSGVGRYLLAAIRGRLQRESSVELLPFTSAVSASEKTSTAAGSPAPLSVERGFWPPRGVASGSSPSTTAASLPSLPASLETAMPLTLTRAKDSATNKNLRSSPGTQHRDPTTATAAGGSTMPLLLAPGKLLSRRQGSVVSETSGDSLATLQPRQQQQQQHTSSPSEPSVTSSLPVVATPSYLGGAGGGSASTAGTMAPEMVFSLGSLDAMERGPIGLLRPSRHATATGIGSTSPVGHSDRDATGSGGSGGGGGGAHTTSPTQMLKPLCVWGSEAAVPGIGSDGGAHDDPASRTGAGLSVPNLLGSGTRSGSGNGPASSFMDVGMQTLDDYRQNDALIRSGWPPHHRTQTGRPLDSATTTSTTANAVGWRTAEQKDLDGGSGANEQHSANANNNTSPATSQTATTLTSGGGGGGGTTIDSHASYASAGSRGPILHPWCSACGLSHPSSTVCPATRSAEYRSSYSDPFPQKALDSQRIVAGAGSSTTSSTTKNKPVDSETSINNHSSSSGTVPVKDENGALSTSTAILEDVFSPTAEVEAALPPAPVEEIKSLPLPLPSATTAAEEDQKFTEGAMDPEDKNPHYSRYTTVSDTVSLIVCMCGLPGRGKSFVSKRLVRYMNWKGVPCRVFNAGNYRRQLLGVEGTANAEFFNPDNPKGKEMRERMAELACEDLVRFLCEHPLAIGILDATNTTKARRARLKHFFAEEAQRHNLPYRLLFIESVCTDETIITENILRSKCDNDDFKAVKDTNEVIAEFRDRIQQYERVYETLDPDEGLSFIKIINVKHHVIIHKVHTGLGSRIAFFLMNLHPIAYPIYIALPGETKGDAAHVYGGDERLTTEGEAYAVALKHFIQDRYVPNMVVLHATNHSVLSTLRPLIADEDVDAFTGAPKHTPTTRAPPTSVAATSGANSRSTSPAGEGAVASRRVSPGRRRGGGTSDAGGGGEPAALFLHGHRKNCHIVSPTSALEQPPRPIKVQATTDEELVRLRRMAGGDLQEIPVPIAVANASTEKEAAEQPTKKAAPSPVSDSTTQHESDESDDDDDDDDDFAEEVLVPVPGLDSINYGRFSGYTAEWVQYKYPRLSSLLYAARSNPTDNDNDNDDGDGGHPPQDSHMKSANTAAASAANPHAGTRKAAAAAEGQESQPTRTMQDYEGDLPHPHPHSASHATAAAGDESPPTTTSVTTPTTVAEILSHPAPPPVHFSKMADALACLRHVPSPVDPRLAYCVQFPNGESCRQVNVRLEPALMAVMRTQSPVFVVAPSVPAEGVLAFFADVIPELSPTLRLPRHCVLEMGVKDDVTVHRLLPTAGEGVLPVGPSSPVIDQEEIEETLKLASSMRSGTHPFAASQNTEGGRPVE